MNFDTLHYFMPRLFYDRSTETLVQLHVYKFINEKYKIGNLAVDLVVADIFANASILNYYLKMSPAAVAKSRHITRSKAIAEIEHLAANLRILLDRGILTIQDIKLKLNQSFYTKSDFYFAEVVELGPVLGRFVPLVNIIDLFSNQEAAASFHNIDIKYIECACYNLIDPWIPPPEIYLNWEAAYCNLLRGCVPPIDAILHYGAANIGIYKIITKLMPIDFVLNTIQYNRYHQDILLRDDLTDEDLYKYNDIIGGINQQQPLKPRFAAAIFEKYGRLHPMENTPIDLDTFARLARNHILPPVLSQRRLGFEESLYSRIPICIRQKYGINLNVQINIETTQWFLRNFEEIKNKTDAIMSGHFL